MTDKPRCAITGRNSPHLVHSKRPSVFLAKIKEKPAHEIVHTMHFVWRSVSVRKLRRDVQAAITKSANIKKLDNNQPLDTDTVAVMSSKS